MQKQITTNNKDTLLGYTNCGTSSSRSFQVRMYMDSCPYSRVLCNLTLICVKLGVNDFLKHHCKYGSYAHVCKTQSVSSESRNSQSNNTKLGDAIPIVMISFKFDFMNLRYIYNMCILVVKYPSPMQQQKGNTLRCLPCQYITSMNLNKATACILQRIKLLKQMTL